MLRISTRLKAKRQIYTEICFSTEYLWNVRQHQH